MLENSRKTLELRPTPHMHAIAYMTIGRADED
jgi:hypothetical protein